MKTENKISVLIVDANTTFRFIATEELKTRGFNVISAVGDGKCALQIIEEDQPDVVLIDLVIPVIDGIGVLKQIHERENIKKPIFIVSTSMSTDYSQREAFKWGAAYYLIKPYDFDLVGQRIQDIFQPETPSETLVTELKKSRRFMEYTDDLESEITALLLEMGVPAHIKGYQYLRASIMLATTDNEAVNAVTKILYPTIAKQFSTTSSRVERAIRHAIEVAWERGDLDILHSFFGYTISNTRGKPTNSEFIALLSDKLRLKNKKRIG